ncbi:MAG: hypothetical protein KC910_05260 [Candidatus Eremiobacteraeota bacterium]|nr:hypothetical protein [Candidatus Eremiobacteraeota bacterium]
MSRRGLALLPVLMVGLLLLLFGLTLVNLATVNYRAAAIRFDQQVALEGARAGVDEVAAELMNDVDFGKAGQAVSQTLADGCTYRVTFAVGPEPYSVNNLDGLGTASGWNGRTVPPHCAHLVAVATTRTGRRRIVESVVTLETIPYTLAGSGTVSGDSITVAGADSLVSALAGDNPLPAHVYSDSSSGTAITLSGPSVVSGDVRTPGGVSLDPLTTVGGTVDPGASSVQLPLLDIQSFSNVSFPGVQVVPGGSYGLLSPVNTTGGPGLPATHVLSGPVYIDGSVHLTGNVLLQNAFVFVDGSGDFEVDGMLTGTGSLFVTGDTSFLGAAVLDQDNKIAVFGQGTIEIPTGSFFQGALYSNAGITTATNMTVLGSVIANGPGGPASVQLGALSRVIHVPEISAFASYWFARGGNAAGVRRLFWNEVR